MNRRTRRINKFKNLTIVQILLDSIRDFSKNDSIIFAAGTAFYTIFSMPALLIIILNIGSTFYQESQIKDELLVQVEELAGQESAKTLEDIMDNFTMNSEGVISNIIAIGVLIFSATTVFVGLQNSINHIWHIKAKPERGFLKFIVNRLLSFSMVGSIGFILLVSLLLDALIVIFFNYFEYFMESFTAYLITIANFVFTQALLVIIFALMYKILPDAKVRWKDTWIGAFVTMILFAGGKYLIGMYIGNTDVGSAYGTAGSLVVLLIWVYYSVVIFLFGAQITFYIAENTGGGVNPNAQAVRVELKEIEDEVIMEEEADEEDFSKS